MEATHLPAGPQRPALHYQTQTYVNPMHPVTVRMTRHGWETTGIDWADMGTYDKSGGMHIIKPYQLVAYKSRPRPAWAMNDLLLREHVVRFLENRTWLQPLEGATLAERRERITLELEARRPHYDALLTKLCREYVELKKTAPADPYLRKLEIQIQNADTQIMYLEKSVGVITSIAYLYFRANMDSVGVGIALGIAPTMVRTTIHRMNKLWDNLQDPNWIPRYKGFLSRLERRYTRDLKPGTVLGSLTVLGAHFDYVPVEVIAKLEPRSLVGYERGSLRTEEWVDNKVLQHTGWRTATMRREPHFESYDCKCACGQQITATANKLRTKLVTSCGCGQPAAA